MLNTVSVPVVLIGGPFGAMVVRDDDGETVAFVGDERYVRVEYGVGDEPSDEVSL